MYFEASQCTDSFAAEMVTPERCQTCQTYDSKSDFAHPKSTLEKVRPQFFVVGGCLAGAELSCVQHYDPSQNAWDIRQPMPTERRWCSGAQCMGKIYVIGGQQEGHVLGTVERYDVEMGLWESVPDMPTPREACGVASCGSRLYVFGGWICSYSHF